MDHDLEGYEVETDTLEPRFRRGDVLICSPEGASLEECIGRECLVDLNDKRYVRLVEKGASDRVVTLRSYRVTTPLFVDEKPKRLSPIIAIIPHSNLTIPRV